MPIAKVIRYFKQGSTLLFRSSLFVLLLMTVIQCGPSNKENNSNDKRLGFGPESFNIGDCNLSPLNGFDFDSNTFNGPTQSSGYFNKSLSLQAFHEALDSSSYSIVDALYRQNVNLYRIPQTNSQNCQYFDFIFTAPEIYQQQWNVLNPRSTRRGRLLGLFTTFFEKNPSSLQVTLNQPTILLRGDTQKWTLVHEMAHYLFAKDRASQHNMPFKRELEAHALRSKNLAVLTKNQLTSNSPSSLADQLMDHYQSFWDANFELDSRGPLEEFTIESLLVEKFQLNQLTGVNGDTNIRQAYFYMSFNAREVTPSYRRFLQELEELNLQQWPSAQRKLDLLKAKIRSTLSFIEEKIQLVTPTHRPLFDIADAALDSNDFEFAFQKHYDLDELRNRHQLFLKW